MKNIYFLFMSVLLTSPFGQTFAQKKPENLKDWYNLDPIEDSIQGISVNKAYEILKGRKSKSVIVAVIDSGVDIEHEDLQGNIWVNEDETPGNGIDDDDNGYIDDVNGWNFIGGKNGNVNEDTHEITRVYKDLKSKYDGMEKKDVSRKNRDEYEYWLKIKKNFENRLKEANEGAQMYTGLNHNYNRFYNLAKYYLDVEELALDDLNKINSPDSLLNISRNFLGYVSENMPSRMSLTEIKDGLEEGAKYYQDQLDYTYNLEFNPRDIVGDNYSDKSERYYGNNDVEGPDASHGTGVAGIIAAGRDNGIGIDGINTNVKIMSVRTVPKGDERDKDVANAIRYAVDNGAQIINMSFGKTYSPEKKIVFDAIKYAEKNNVLLIHAAGNSSKDIDVMENYPNRKIPGSDEVKNWLEVGANSWGKDENFVANFSNYGDESVDIFAPGVQIYTLKPENEYEAVDGTSFAAPTTAGLAALLMSYFPGLDIFDVRQIIIDSSRKFDGLEVLVPGEENKKVNFSNLSIHGGIINAEEAVKMAMARELEKN